MKKRENQQLKMALRKFGWIQISTNERHHAYVFARECAECHKHIMLGMENEWLNEFIEWNVWEFSGVSHFGWSSWLAKWFVDAGKRTDKPLNFQIFIQITFGISKIWIMALFSIYLFF